MNQVTVKGVTYEYDANSECNLANTTADDIVRDNEATDAVNAALTIAVNAALTIRRARVQLSYWKKKAQIAALEARTRLEAQGHLYPHQLYSEYNQYHEQYAMQCKFKDAIDWTAEKPQAIMSIKKEFMHLVKRFKEIA